MPLVILSELRSHVTNFHSHTLFNRRRPRLCWGLAPALGKPSWCLSAASAVTGDTMYMTLSSSAVPCSSGASFSSALPQRSAKSGEMKIEVTCWPVQGVAVGRVACSFRAAGLEAAVFGSIRRGGTGAALRD